MSIWAPTAFLRFEGGYDTSMGTARIVTDAGPAYIKAMGNRQGPHCLACEWVGTQLARWLGLPTFDFALMPIDAKEDEIPFARGGRADSGPAFVAKATPGHVWDGSEDGLKGLVNPPDIPRLVVFDTWTRNCDRHPPDLRTRRPNYDNVFLADVGEKGKGQSRLLAIDHTHCFTCGRDLTPNIANVDLVRDPRLYGLFPAFVSRVHQEEVESAVDRLRQLKEDTVVEIIQTVPAEWEVDRPTRAAWKASICDRAAFVAASIVTIIAKECWPGRLFDTTR